MIGSIYSIKTGFTNLKLIWISDNLKWLLLGKLLRFCLTLIRIWVSSSFNWLLRFDILGGLNYFALCSRAVHPAVMKTVDSVLPKIQFLIIEMKRIRPSPIPESYFMTHTLLIYLLYCVRTILWGLICSTKDVLTPKFDLEIEMA